MLEQIIITGIDNVNIIDSARDRRFANPNRENYGLGFCQSGCITYTQNGKQYVSNPDHAILLPKGANYSLYCNDSGFFPMINFQCMETFCPDEIMVFPLQHPDEYLKDFQKLQQMYIFRKDALRAMSILYSIIGRLADQERPNQTLLGPVMEYLHIHLSDPNLNNQQLAKQSGFSEVHFRQLFRTSYGMSPKQYILTMRMRLACLLLSETRDSVGEIALHCGFSSVYHFSRAFRQSVGCTPTEYRTASHRLGI